MESDIPPFKPGLLSYEHLNLLVGAANLSASQGVGGALRRTPGGNLYAAPCREFAAIRLTGGGTGGLYDWTLVRPIESSPYWEDTTDTGTAADEPASEVNEVDSIDTADPGPVVWAWREPGTKGWQFMGDGCA